MTLLPLRLCISCITLYRPTQSSASDQDQFCCLLCQWDYWQAQIEKEERKRWN
jgi:hypothetical protein